MIIKNDKLLFFFLKYYSNPHSRYTIIHTIIQIIGEYTDYIIKKMSRRWTIPKHVKTYIYSIQPWCVYTREPIYTDQISSMTVEHIIPCRLLTVKHQQLNPINLRLISSPLNSFRRDFRYADIFDDIDPSRLESLKKCLRDRKRRIFIPVYGKRIIAESCHLMFTLYPQLYKDHFDSIFLSRRTFIRWMDSKDEF